MPPKVSPTDLISGEMYLKLINDYKEYDKRQKAKIEKLQNRVDILTWLVDDLNKVLEESEENESQLKRSKLKRQRKVLRTYIELITKLKCQIKEMSEQIDNLKSQLANKNQ